MAGDERWDARTRGQGAVVLGVLLALGVLVSDIAIGRGRVAVSSLLIAAPLLCGVAASVEQTRGVGVLAVLVAASAFLWAHDIGSWRYWVPLVVVAMGSGFAIVTAVLRRRLGRDADRMAVLAQVAEVARGGRPLERMAQELADVVVPRVADLCVIEAAVPDGGSRRVAVAAAGHTRGMTAQLRDADEQQLSSELGVLSPVVVDLSAGGRVLGRLLLATRPPRPALCTPADVSYVHTLAGRLGLALDNVTLSTALSSAEQRLDVILANVDAAVTVRDRDGRMVYANQAAAELLRAPGVDALMQAHPGEVIDRFDVYTEEGDPVNLADLPGTRILSGERDPGPMIVRNVVKETGQERWLLNKASAVAAPDGTVLMSVSLTEDVTETKRNEIAQRLLASTARSLAEASDPTATLEAAVRAAVPSLADWAGVDLVDSRGRVRTVAIAHRDPEKVKLGWRLRTRWPVEPDETQGMMEVMRTGRAQLVRDIPDEMLTAGARDPEHLAVLREVGLNSTMIAPIRVGQQILGTLSFVSSTSRRFDERDLELACDLGRQIGIVIDRAELHAAQSHIAQTLQAGLIPPSLPPVEGWEISCAYRAAGRANDVGGDFYDLVSFEGGWVAIIGDVLGKGAEAAALTAMARHTLAAIIGSTGEMGHALEVLNQRLRQRDRNFRSLCTVAAVLMTGDDTATIFSAGHPLPLLSRGAVARPVGEPSAMLGFLDELEVRPTAVAIEPGDRLVLYTDGVLDAIGADDRFGEMRLIETVGAAGAAQGTAARILAGVDAFLTGEQVDDIAIMSLMRSPVAVAAPAPRSS